MTARNLSPIIIALCVSAMLCERPSLAQPIGADVVYTDIHQIQNHGGVGGIRAYSLGSRTCNIGDAHMLWVSSGTPGFASNAYRLHNGRLMQIGVGFVKHACCVSNTSGCGMTCQSGPSGHLRIGCMDTYSASWNSQQNRLGPRFNINPYNGQFGSFSAATGDAIFKRLQVKEGDMTAASFPGALYFVEGVYVGTEDAQAGNWHNNASYRRVNVDASFNMTLQGTTFTTIPAIHAWRDHGNGIGIPDTSVTILNVDVPNEGRFIAGHKVIDNGNGTWRYEYAVFNINSFRAGGSLSIPIPKGVAVSNIGFNDVAYHSGEPVDNTDWIVLQDEGTLTWRSPQTFEENANSNALRWGTMYNFWFDADQPPQDGMPTLGLFRPGDKDDPDSVQFSGPIPGQLPNICAADVSPPGGNGEVNANDLLAIINAWGPCSAPCPADIEPPGGDGIVNVNDLVVVINNWGQCP